MSLSGYDNWLVEPYERMMAESEAYYEWAESQDLDPDDPETEAAYDEWLGEQYDEPDYDDCEDEDYWDGHYEDRAYDHWNDSI